MFDPDCCGVGSGSMWAPLKHSDGSLKPKEMPFSLQSEEKPLFCSACEELAISVCICSQKLNLFLSKTNFLLPFCLYNDPKINSYRSGGFM